MDVKIINKNVVPDRIVLYEGDRGSKNLVFSTQKINDGVNVEVLNGYLEVEREKGLSDRFLLEKTIADNMVYFTLPIGLALTETADLLSTQVVFENESKSISYKTKVFYIDVKFSVDGESSYEQVMPSVITQLETKLENAVETCENIVENCAEDIKNEALEKIENAVMDEELSLESVRPVQNKVITEAVNTKLDKFTTNTGSVRYYGVKENGEQYVGYVAQNPSWQLNNGFLAVYKSRELEGDVIGGSGGGAVLITNTPTKPYHTANKKYVDDKFSVFSPLHHFVIVPPEYDWTYNFYMVLPNRTEAFNTLAEFLDYVANLDSTNNVIYFGGTYNEMYFDPTGITELKFELDDSGISIVGINLNGDVIPKDELESDTGATQFMFSDTVIA